MIYWMKLLKASSESDTGLRSTRDQSYSSIIFLTCETDLHLLNESLSIIGASPVKQKKSKKQTNYRKKKRQD